MEAAHKTSLAKGVVEFASEGRYLHSGSLPGDLQLFARSTFATKPKTLKYYEYGVKSLLSFEKLAYAHLDTITGEIIGGFVAKRRDAGLEVSSINRSCRRSGGCSILPKSGTGWRRTFQV